MTDNAFKQYFTSGELEVASLVLEQLRSLGHPQWDLLPSCEDHWHKEFAVEITRLHFNVQQRPTTIAENLHQQRFFKTDSCIFVKKTLLV